MRRSKPYIQFDNPLIEEPNSGIPNDNGYAAGRQGTDATASLGMAKAVSFERNGARAGSGGGKDVATDNAQS